MRATITERGNGFPGVGRYIPGDDGQLYRLVRYVGPIHTGGCGEGNYNFAEVELADWAECAEGAEFPALAIL